MRNKVSCVCSIQNFYNAQDARYIDDIFSFPVYKSRYADAHDTVIYQ